MENLLRELRHVARALSKRPGFTLVAVFTLALGIGATTAIFTVLNAVVLQPLPYTEPERLVRIENRVPGVNPERNWGLSPAGYFHFLENTRSLESLGVYTTPRISITGGEGPVERVQAARVSGELLGVLGIRPALGRLITPQDNQTPANATGVLPGPAVPVAVLSHDLWQRRFGASPDVIGTTIKTGGISALIVGVLEQGADLPDPGIDVDVWLPLGLNPAAPPVSWHTFQAIGRLDEGVSLTRAQQELAGFTRRFVELFPSAYSARFMEETGFAVKVTPLRNFVVGDTARTIWILLAAVALLLLIACANVANIFLVRTEGRGQEMAVRTALGATRAHLVRSFLAEGIAVALLGGAFSLVLSWSGVSVLTALAPAGLPRLDEINVGWPAVVFTLVLATLVGALVGSFPLLRFKIVLASTTLREQGRGSTSGRQRNLARNLLVVGQVAMAVVLLTAAGLLLRSFQQLRAVEPGIDPANVLAMEITLPNARYDSYAKVSAFYESLTRQIETLPGVRSAGVVDDMPFVSTGVCADLSVEEPPASAAAVPGCVLSSVASPGFFETLDISVEGEMPDWNDVNRRNGMVVVSRALAERLWPGEDPIGKGIRGNGSAPPFYRVAGVANDVHADGLDKAPVEVVYFPLIPLERANLWGPARSTTLLVRTQAGQTEALVAPVRRILSGLDPDVPIANVRTVERIIADSMAQTSFTMLLLGVAAAVALALGAVGLYGVLSYVVSERRREIGIRMALGAGQGRVAVMVLSRSLRLVTGGILTGLLATFAVTRVLRSLLFEITPTDPLTLAAVSLVLGVVALLASYVPARRATRVEPVTALRYE